MSSIAKPTSEGPSYEKERKEAYVKFRHAMEKVYQALREDSEVHLEQMKKGIEEYKIIMQQRGK